MNSLSLTVWNADSLTGRKFWTFPGDLLSEVTTTWEVKVCDGSMRACYSTSVDVADNFILNTHVLA